MRALYDGLRLQPALLVTVLLEKLPSTGIRKAPARIAIRLACATVHPTDGKYLKQLSGTIWEWAGEHGQAPEGE